MSWGEQYVSGGEKTGLSLMSVCALQTINVRKYTRRQSTLPDITGQGPVSTWLGIVRSYSVLLPSAAQILVHIIDDTLQTAMDLSSILEKIFF